MSSHLPTLPTTMIWTSDIHNAVQILNNLYTNALLLVTSQNFNQTRLSWHLDTLCEDALPLLSHLSSSVEHIPEEWLLECGNCFGNLIEQLKNLVHETKENDEGYVFFCTVAIILTDIK